MKQSSTTNLYISSRFTTLVLIIFSSEFVWTIQKKLNFQNMWTWNKILEYINNFRWKSHIKFIFIRLDLKKLLVSLCCTNGYCRRFVINTIGGKKSSLVSNTNDLMMMDYHRRFMLPTGGENHPIFTKVCNTNHRWKVSPTIQGKSTVKK